jgi:hypothetical protein
LPAEWRIPSPWRRRTFGNRSRFPLHHAQIPSDQVRRFARPQSRIATRLLTVTSGAPAISHAMRSDHHHLHLHASASTDLWPAVWESQCRSNHFLREFLSVSLLAFPPLQWRALALGFGQVQRRIHRDSKGQIPRPVALVSAPRPRCKGTA